MATIPIEVIVQDAEAPIVPSEDGTNINTNTEDTVAVPDTGGSGSNIFTDSASSIILPAILLVLAIGSIVAILIHKYHKQKRDKTTRKEKLAVAASSTIAVLAVTVLIGNLVIPATKAATSDIEDGITPAEDKVSIVVTRDGGSVETSIESKATITSTSDFGYKVLLSMAGGVETSSLYLNGDEASEHYIASVEAENEEGAELTDNTWGYALEEGSSYSAVPLLDSAVTVEQGNEPVEDEALNIYYGVKVSSDLPAGTYSGGEIEYSLVALEPTISDLTYMQDFAKLSADVKNSVLNSMREETTYTLKDQRDDQDYTVAKLKDGKVWMTKNLNLSGGTEITSELSDIPENYTLPVANGFQEGNKLPVSSQTGFSNDDTAYVYNTNTDNCAEPGCYSYYSWTAATAGSIVDGTGSEMDAEYSICPKGWELPNSRSQYSSEYSLSDMQILVASYGGDDFYNQAGPGTVANFTLSGDYFDVGFIDGNQYGYYWSVTSIGNSAYDLMFNPHVANSQHSYGNRKPGRSVRCIVY